MAKILVVEDEPTVLNALRVKLEKEGYTVLVAQDGEEALDKIRTRPDAVILDIQLPKKTGLEVLEEVQSLPQLRSIPIIVISNSGQPLELEQAVRLGAKDFLIKTQFTPQDVLDKLKLHLASGQNVEHRLGEIGKRGGRNVLVVEDDVFLRQLLTEKLKKEGFEVYEASGGEEALELIKKKLPMLVLLDLVMPGVDGFQVLQETRKDPITQNIPVIVLSNLGESSDIERAKKLGVDDYLIKAHFILEEIVEKISQVLAKRYL